MIVTGETDSEEPYAAYAISGRSKGSQKRKFERSESKIRVSPLGDLDSDQEKLKDLIFYDAMRTKGDKLIVTNGAQTDFRLDGKTTLNFFDGFDSGNPVLSSERIMTEWGYEADPPIFTPRISLVRYPNKTAVFSMATKFRDGVGAGAVTVEVGSGDDAWGLATYKAEDDEAASWSIRNSASLFGCLTRMKIRAGSAQELAEDLYEFLDPRCVVATAGAVLRGNSWDIVVKNRFETEESFRQKYPA